MIKKGYWSLLKQFHTDKLMTKYYLGQYQHVNTLETLYCYSLNVTLCNRFRYYKYLISILQTCFKAYTVSRNIIWRRQAVLTLFNKFYDSCDFKDLDWRCKCVMTSSLGPTFESHKLWCDSSDCLPYGSGLE